jgi:hypothetical protein
MFRPGQAVITRFMNKYEQVRRLAIKTGNAGVAYAAINAQANLINLFGPVTPRKPKRDRTERNRGGNGPK